MWTTTLLSAGFTGGGRRRLFRPGLPCGCELSSRGATGRPVDLLTVGNVGLENSNEHDEVGRQEGGPEEDSLEIPTDQGEQHGLTKPSMR
jgi:hypothetical protein